MLEDFLTFSCHCEVIRTRVALYNHSPPPMTSSSLFLSCIFSVSFTLFKKFLIAYILHLTHKYYALPHCLQFLRDYCVLCLIDIQHHRCKTVIKNMGSCFQAQLSSLKELCNFLIFDIICPFILY